jgi:hypothetical protein
MLIIMTALTALTFYGNTTLPFFFTLAPGGSALHQPDIWGLTKGMLYSIYILLLKTIPFLVQQNVGLVPGQEKDGRMSGLWLKSRTLSTQKVHAKYLQLMIPTKYVYVGGVHIGNPSFEK